MIIVIIVIIIVIVVIVIVVIIIIIIIIISSSSAIVVVVGKRVVDSRRSHVHSTAQHSKSQRFECRAGQDRDEPRLLSVPRD